jgi:hypothetical protein
MVGEVTGPLLAELRQIPNIAVLRPPGGAEDSLAAGVQALREASRRTSPFVVVPADPLAAVAAEWQAMWDVNRAPRDAAGFEVRAGEALAAWHAHQFELPDYYLVVARAQPVLAEQPGRAGVRARSAGPGPGSAGAAVRSREGSAGTRPGQEAQPPGGPSLHLGPIRAVRPRRVAVAPVSAAEAAGGAAQAAPVVQAIRSLPTGPWWPPLDQVIAAARSFYPGGLAESQDPPGGAR